MAESLFTSQINRDFLECRICFKPFENPKGLPCLHAFCFKCLKQWAAACSNDYSVVTCPICQKVHRIPENRVEGFPRHFMVTNLREAVDVRRKTQNDKHLKKDTDHFTYANQVCFGGNKDGTQAVEKILNEYRLGDFLAKLVELGVTCIEDLADIRTDDLKELGMSKIQLNRFRDMASAYGLDLLWESSSSSSLSAASSEQSLKSNISEKGFVERSNFSQGSSDYTLKYQTQHHVLLGSPQELTHLDPNKTTMKDLIGIILRREGYTSEQSAELYTREGVPLTNDSYLATLSLSTRCIASGSTILAIICKGGRDSAAAAQPTVSSPDLPNERHVLNCRLITGEHYQIPVNLDEDTAKDVKTKLAEISGIPESVQILKVQKVESFQLGESVTLEDNDLVKHDWLNVFLVQRQELDSTGWEDNFTCEIQPYVEQTAKGMGMFAATLYVVASKIFLISEIKKDSLKLIGVVRRLTGLSPLATALYLLGKRRSLSCAHKVAIVEGLYLLFRRLLPKPQRHGRIGSNHTFVSDDSVFEHSNICWMYLLTLMKPTDLDNEVYREVRFKCAESNQTLVEPVTVSDIPGYCFSRSQVIKCIQEKKKLKGKLVTDPTSISPDQEMQKLLLSFLNVSGLERFGQFCNNCTIWDPPAKVMSERPEHVEAMDIKNFRKERKNDLCKLLKLGPTLDLQASTGACVLTVNNKQEYVVYTGISKEVGTPLELYNPATTETEKVDKHKLASKLEDFDFKQGTEVTAHTVTRKPKEAIVVLLDVSRSMKGHCFDSHMTKLIAAKELFYAFAERSMAYNLQHIIGLTTFSKHINVIGECSEFYETFKKLVESVKGEEGTSLYDAICETADQLDVIKRSYPGCKRRVICLTDGIDFSSQTTAVEVVGKLMQVGCVLDAVQIFSVEDLELPKIQKDINILKSIALATGGCCFKPASLSEGRKVFEMETVLSIRTRKVEQTSKSISTESDLQRMAALPWTTEPPCNKPEALSKPAANTHAVLVKAAKETPAHTTKGRSKRLLREMVAIQREPHPAFSIYPSENNFDFWKILMVGPTDTPYEGGVFSLYAEFPNNYPDAPPTVRFLTPVYHCNINSIGRICHGIFDRNYTSDTNIKTILSCVFGLLMTPEPKDPLDGVLAEEYFTNRDLYNENAKKWTKKHAGTSLEDREKEILESSTLPKRPTPSHLICPLTKQLYVDPVQTPYGYVYERHAIEAALNNLPSDPQDGEPLTKKDLRPATSVRRQVTDFRESLAKVAACWLN